MKEYICLNNLDLYETKDCQKLATQAARGRHLRPITQEDNVWQVQLCEDEYQAWLPAKKIIDLQQALLAYKPSVVTRETISKRLETIIAYTLQAMQQPNYYLWGGTVGPNYDCSGLIQAAFAASRIWLPRDSYQQADFTQKITQAELSPGDLIFFGYQKVTHVGLYRGKGSYIHSSGKDLGRNSIGIDQLGEDGDPISRAYYRQIRGFGRVVSSYMAKVS